MQSWKFGSEEDNHGPKASYTTLKKKGNTESISHPWGHGDTGAKGLTPQTAGLNLPAGAGAARPEAQQALHKHRAMATRPPPCPQHPSFSGGHAIVTILVLENLRQSKLLLISVRNDLGGGR